MASRETKELRKSFHIRDLPPTEEEAILLRNSVQGGARKEIDGTKFAIDNPNTELAENLIYPVDDGFGVGVVDSGLFDGSELKRDLIPGYLGLIDGVGNPLISVEITSTKIAIEETCATDISFHTYARADVLLQPEANSEKARDLRKTRTGIHNVLMHQIRECGRMRQWIQNQKVVDPLLWEPSLIVQHASCLVNASVSHVIQDYTHEIPEELLSFLYMSTRSLNTGKDCPIEVAEVQINTMRNRLMKLEEQLIDEHDQQLKRTLINETIKERKAYLELLEQKLKPRRKVDLARLKKGRYFDLEEGTPAYCPIGGPLRERKHRRNVLVLSYLLRLQKDRGEIPRIEIDRPTEPIAILSKLND